MIGCCVRHVRARHREGRGHLEEVPLATGVFSRDSPSPFTRWHLTRCERLVPGACGLPWANRTCCSVTSIGCWLTVVVNVYGVVRREIREGCGAFMVHHGHSSLHRITCPEPSPRAAWTMPVNSCRSTVCMQSREHSRAQCCTVFSIITTPDSVFTA